MTSTDSRKQGRGKQCERCRQARKKCKYEDESTTCNQCERAGAVCAVPDSLSQPRQKRKKDEIENSSDCEFERSDRSISATTLVFNEPERVARVARTVRRTRKKPRAVAASAQPLRRSSRTPVSSKEPAEDWACGLCNGPYLNNAKHKADKTMIRCDACPIWYHVTCLWFTRVTKPMIWFSPATGDLANQDASIFFCPNCLDRTKENKNTEYLSDTFTTVRQMLWSAVQHVDPKSQAASPEIKADAETPEPQPQQQPQQSIMWETETGDPVFEPAKFVKYRGFDKDMAEGLIRRLDRSILNYGTEVGQCLEGYPGKRHAFLTHPLKEWERVDPTYCKVYGREWYSSGGLDPGPGHTSLTAGLRRLLCIPDGEALDIHPDLDSLSFAQVHKGLVALFIFDIINNKLHVDEWDNMKAVRAMLPAIKNFGDERWNKQGRHVLREVRLRAFENKEFQKEILQHRERLTNMLKSYIGPLTGNYNNIDSWQFTSMDLMSDTLKLCFYLHSLGAKLEIIHPKIGDPFDPTLHQVDDGECEHDPLKSSPGKVRWVLRPGFKCEEAGVDGHRSMIIEALVMI